MTQVALSPTEQFYNVRDMIADLKAKRLGSKHAHGAAGGRAARRGVPGRHAHLLCLPRHGGDGH